MRNFINIINRKSLSESISAPHVEESILLEAKHFEAMFSVLEAIGQRYHQNDILAVVQECKTLVKALKRSDRQAWGARILRLWMFENLTKWNIGLFDYDAGGRQNDPHNHAKEEVFQQFQAEVTKLDIKYKTEYLKTIGEDWNTDQRSDPKRLIKQMILGHYLGIPYTKIQNYVFGKSITQTLTDLAALENEFKERTKSLLPLMAGDKIIITMPDNFVWVMLDRGYCGEEANAMGHCGNAGAKPDDRILSLRRIKDTVDGVAYMEVFLTFILNGDGKLGEMKGRNNDKPVARYHPMIVELLRNPIVKGIRGGGYMPKNNFNMNDLPEDVREKLLDEKPSLGDWQARLKKARTGGDLKAFETEVIAALKEATSWTDKAYSDGENSIVLYQWKSVDDLVDEMSDDDHTKEVASGDYNAEVYETSDDQVESFMESLPTQYQIMLGNHALKLVQENGDEDELEEFDPSTMSECLQKFEEYDSEMKSALESGTMSGEESGAQSEAHEYLVKAIEGFKPKIGAIEIPTYVRDDGKTGWVWDSPVKLAVTLEQACQVIDATADDADEYEYSEDNDMMTIMFDGEEDALKIDPPYYGYSGFDEDQALESFINMADFGEGVEVERRPTDVDFDTMPVEEVKTWLEGMYAKIPDGFIRKVHVDALPEDRIRSSAKGLFKTYYG